MNHLEKLELEREIANSIQREENSFVINGVLTPLPKPQKAGTSIQQRTYAEMKAQEILKTIKE